jgi:micrococcal nuclease
MATTLLIRRIAAGLLLGMMCLCARAGDFAGIVTHVSDGDTLWVRPFAGGTARQVRLEGIDAPEICQPYGERSRAALASRALHQRVQVASRASDSYQRAIGRVRVRGQDLGDWMVSHGHAWSYRFRGDAGPYSRQEARARSARLGMWRGPAPLQPREFRKRHGSCRP